MATGEKVSNGVISRRIPGNSFDLKTVFETAKSKGYRTGFITTSYIIDATPAAFISHSHSRADYSQISLGIFNFKPNLTIGGLKHLYIDDFALNGFAVYEFLEDFSSSQNPYIFIKLGDDTAQYEYDTLILSGILPHNLSRSAAIATNYLDNTDNGAGSFPAVEWKSDSINGIYSHTGREVPVYIYSDLLSENDLHFVEDNTDISRVINCFIGK